MLDTKTLTKQTIKDCRDTEKWLTKKVKKHAPKGTTCEIEELRVNDDLGDEYIFCEVTLTCNKRTHHFNFYAGTDGCTLVERLGGKKGDDANGETYGKDFQMDFCMPSADDMGDLEYFLEKLEKYVPKMPKKKKKAKSHVYHLITNSHRENGHDGDEDDEDETIYETREKARKQLAKEAKEALDLMDGINTITIGEEEHTKESALNLIKSGIDDIEMSGDIDGDYFVFWGEITEKDVF